MLSHARVSAIIGRTLSGTGKRMGIVANHSIPNGEAENQESLPSTGYHGHAKGVDLVIFAMVGIAAAVTWAGIVPRINGIDLLAVTAVLGGGYPVFREALQNLVARRMTMELSMTIALVAALAIREFTTALFILLFVLPRSWRS